MQPLAGGAGGVQVLLPPLSEVFWAGLALAIIVGALWKYALPKLTSLLDERSAQIEAGLRASERAEDELATARAHAAAEREQARTEANQLREQARAEAKDIVAAARVAAVAEGERVREQFDAQLAASKAAAERELRGDVGRLATELARRIVGAELSDPDRAAAVIDQAIEELERAPIKRPARSEA
ncbi:ATP synthase F0 subunit B [Buchananella hordeovulneris]|uniref:ATP synthase subunit b n=1 Tax=Buchananella hordeovulneris TaxID=52770 RepID=A0A1Q5PVY5_9ACTO|nr:ATP synthase F0 subunit B [Buchananella hordeovulneris]